MKRRNVRTADLGGHERREFLVRLPLARYEGLTRIAKQQQTSLSYQVNQAVRAWLEQKAARWSEE